MKIELQPTDLKQLSHITFVANTPGYIFNTIIEEGIASRLSEIYKTKDILANIRSIASRSSKNVKEEEALILIALAITLRYKSPDDANELTNIEIPWLNWWEELKQLILNDTRSDNTALFEIESTIDEPPKINPNIPLADNHLIIDFEGEPKDEN